MAAFMLTEHWLGHQPGGANIPLTACFYLILPFFFVMTWFFLNAPWKIWHFECACCGENAPTLFPLFLCFCAKSTTLLILVCVHLGIVYRQIPSTCYSESFRPSLIALLFCIYLHLFPFPYVVFSMPYIHVSGTPPDMAPRSWFFVLSPAVQLS